MVELVKGKAIAIGRIVDHAVHVQKDHPHGGDVEQLGCERCVLRVIRSVNEVSSIFCLLN